MGWLQSAIKWFLPDDGTFFETIEAAAIAAEDSGRMFDELARTQDRDARVVLMERIREAEHAGDKAKKDIADALDATFVTPIDREDLYHLAAALESVSDFVSATANQLTVHQMDTLPEGTRELASVLFKATTHLRQATTHLKNGDGHEKIRALCTSVHYLEHEADVIFRLRIGDLFSHEKDAIQLIKHKEFLEGLEDSIDQCAKVATVLEAILIKNG